MKYVLSLLFLLAASTLCSAQNVVIKQYSVFPPLFNRTTVQYPTYRYVPQYYPSAYQYMPYSCYNVPVYQPQYYWCPRTQTWVVR